MARNLLSNWEILYWLVRQVANMERGLMALLEEMEVTVVKNKHQIAHRQLQYIQRMSLVPMELVEVFQDQEREEKELALMVEMVEVRELLEIMGIPANYTVAVEAVALMLVGQVLQMHVLAALAQPVTFISPKR